MDNPNNLTKAVDKQIKDLISYFFKSCIIFTKYDITKEIRNCDFWVEHDDVKRIFENIDIPNDYICGNYKINGKYMKLYYPDTYDDPISKYNLYGVKNPLHKTKQKENTDKAKKLFDKRNRYCVSAKHVKQAGFNSKSTVLVLSENGNIILKEYDNKYMNYKDKTLDVDCYYNIRISKQYFKKSFGRLPDNISVNVSKRLIEIKETT